MDVFTLIIDFLKVVIPATLVFIIQRKTLLGGFKKRRTKEKHNDLKISYLPQIMQLKCMEEINSSVDKIFKETKATRFVILIGVNGKEEMGHVSAIYCKNKDNKDIDQTKRYRSLDIDYWYKKMLKTVESVGSFVIDTFNMDRCILRSIYYKEGVSHSVVKFISRTAIDKDNDFLMYCSFATDEEDRFTEYEEMILTSEMNEIIRPAIKKLN